jgi:hypothetical protein
MSLLLAFALLAEGDASYYAPGLMERVLEYRLDTGRVQPCTQCIGYVALLDATDMGRLVWLDWGGGSAGDGIDGPYLVADCAQAEHRASLVARRRVVEVDWPTAKRHRMAGPVSVRVLWLPPGAACPVRGAC